jgi:hypothetical protein
MLRLRLLLIGFLSYSCLTRAADEPDSDRVSKLLSAAKTQAFDVKSDVQTMDFFMGSDLSWESHTVIVNLYKEHIDAIRRQATMLDDVRGIASPLQKTTIDQVSPLLRELASDAEALIDRIDKNPKRLNSGDYKDYVKVNGDLAAELAALVGNFVDYGKTQQQLDQLTGKLNLPLASAAIGK